jgi:G:T-mismatch repair DNA endonuclease (very short patch repair protein)
MPKKKTIVFLGGCNQKQHEPLSKQNTPHENRKTSVEGSLY